MQLGARGLVAARTPATLCAPRWPARRRRYGQAHDYKRRGNSTLFTALEIATGQIKAKHSKRRQRVEFLDFMWDGAMRGRGVRSEAYSPT